jgi:hypothetical protein
MYVKKEHRMFGIQAFGGVGSNDKLFFHSPFSHIPFSCDSISLFLVVVCKVAF